MRGPVANGGEGRATRVAARLIELSDAIEARRPDAAIIQALAQARARCAGEPALKALRELPTVLEAWQRVWPRLGARQDFRLAVAREARVWAEQLAVSEPTR